MALCNSEEELFRMNVVYLVQTCLCTHVQRITIGVKRLCQFNGQLEGLASPQDQLLRGNLAGVVFHIVDFRLEVRSHKDWVTRRRRKEDDDAYLLLITQK